MNLPFTRFCEGVGIELRPGQRVLCKVAFDGLDPVDLVGEERELARRIFGATERVTAAQRVVVNATCGGRAGKTRLLCAMRLLHLGLTFDLSRLAPGESGYGMIVGPKMTHAKQGLAYVRGAVRMVKALSDSVLVDNKEELVLRRGKGRTISFLCAAASAKGDTQRGKSLFGAAMEEAAFFRDEETGAVNDVELFQAMLPRVMLGGQLVIASTPWTETGLLWDLHERNFGHPVDALAAHAPTLVLRDEPDVREKVEALRVQDPANARREYDAVFVKTDASSFFDGPTVEAAVCSEAATAQPGDILTAGGDFGFVRNTSALVVGAWRGGVYHVLRVVERIPGDTPLVPSETILAFGREARDAGATTIVCDGHYREAVREHLYTSGVYLSAAPEGQQGKADTYAKLRMLLREGRVRLPDGPRLLKQLREVSAKLLAGGGIAISSPTWTDGAHGDLVAALVLATWQDHGTIVAPARTQLGIDEQRAADHERRLIDKRNTATKPSAWARRR